MTLKKIHDTFFSSSQTPTATPASAAVSSPTKSSESPAPIVKADEGRSKLTDEQREALRELGRRGGKKRAANRKAFKENTPAAAIAKANDTRADAEPKS